MNWLAFFYLAYLMKTHGSSTLAVRSCADCKFFLPLTSDRHDAVNAKMGKCTLFPYSDKTVNHLVLGMGESNVDGLFQHATTARLSETMCGHEGVNFIKRPMPIPIRNRPMI